MTDHQAKVTNQFSSNLMPWSLCLLSFWLPFKEFVSLPVLIVFLIWLFDKQGARNLFSGKSRWKVFLILSGFYLLHLCSLFYSKNIQEGLTNLEVKSTLFIFPLVFSTFLISQKLLRAIFLSFVSGCFLFSLLLCIRAIVRSINGELDVWYYEQLSWFQHPSYLAMYINLSIAILLFDAIFPGKLKLSINKFLTLGLLLLFSGMVFLLSSKMGIVTWISVVLITCFLGILRNFSYKRALLLMAGMIALIGVSFFLFPKSMARFENVITAIKSETKPDSTSTESNAIRILIWKESIKLIGSNPFFGVSAGDANDALYNRYITAGMTGAYEKKLNAHSQFFQTTVGLGVVGLVLLLIQLVWLFMVAKRESFLLAMVFAVIVFLNFIPESMLQTSAGSVFYAFFLSIFSYYQIKSKPND